jgi:hypothetical protein
MFAVVMACLMAVLLACYRYAPATLDAVPVGASVRAQISSQAELALRDSFGVNMRVLTGTLVDRQERRLLLQVRTASGAEAFGSQSLYQRIAVSPQDVLRLDVRKLDRVKTGVLTAILAGAAAIVAIKIIGDRRPGTPDVPPGPPPEHIWGVP